MNKNSLKKLNDLLLTYRRVNSRGWHLYAHLEELKEKRFIEPVNFDTITRDMNKKDKVFQEIRAKLRRLKKQIFRIYRVHKEDIPPNLMEMINDFFEDKEELEEKEISEDESDAPPVDEENPWLPWKIPADHLQISPKSGRIQEHYDKKLDGEDQEICDDLADFFFYEFYERGLYKQKRYTHGKNFWRSVHNDERKDYESKLAYICAFNFFSKLVKSDFELKLTPDEITTLRDSAKRTLQNVERGHIGTENMNLFAETFLRHVEEAEKFKESHFYEPKQPKKPIKITPKTSLNQIPPECRKIADEVFNQLKDQYFKASDCRNLMKFLIELRKHNSSTRTQKLMFMKFIPELQRMIDVMENRANS